MTTFLWNIFLAFVWAFAVGEFSTANVAIGFILGYIALWLGEDVLGSARYLRRFILAVEFLLFFVWELLLSNLRIAHDILTININMTPGVLAVPLDAKTDGEITILANLISITPGSVSLDVSKDRKFLYVHTMYMKDPEHEKQRIKNGFERRVLGLLR